MIQTAQKLVETNKGLLNRRIFVDQEIYQQELEQVFGRSWLFIGHESQVPNANDFIAGYMGEDPILLTRDAKGRLHAFLNMCRHRGNRVCRADQGNSPSFMCTYHGWTFASDGKLVGVPGYKEAYFEELDRSQWGLVEAGQIDNYKGLVFATWDKQAPSLQDYMGDMAWYLDMLVDRREGGTEVLAGASRLVINANWKLGADNFAGDGYHVPVNHGSMSRAGINRSLPVYREFSHPVSAGNGHGYLGGYDGPKLNQAVELTGNARVDVIQSYRLKHLKELEDRLGAIRGRQGAIGVATMFPNFTWHPAPMVRCWHPRGPNKTEIWSYCIIDKATPPDIKDALRRNFIMTFGAAGAMEADDMNNWLQITELSRSPAARKVVINQAMGLGHETGSEVLPGKISSSPSEMNQRSFYQRWAEVMDAPSWSDIKLAPRTFK